MTSLGGVGTTSPNSGKFLTVVLVVAALLVGILIGVVITPGTTHTVYVYPPSSVPYTFEPIHNATAGSDAGALLFDPASGDVYVTNQVSANVTVVNASTLAPVANLAIGHAARAITLDPVNGLVYVASNYGSNITVIDPSTNSIVATAEQTGYSNAVGIQYDPDTNLLYVLENTASVLLEMNTTTYDISGIVPIEPNPGGGSGFALVPSTHTIYFPARGVDALEEIGELNGTSFALVPMPSFYGPTSSFYDPSNGYVYVMLGGLLDNPGDLVAVYDPVAGAVVGTMTVGLWPDSYAYDPALHLLFVTCAASDDVAAIDDQTNQVVGSIPLGSGNEPGGIAIDPSSAHLFVSVGTTGRLVEFAILANTPSSVGSVPGSSSISELPLLVRWT